MRDRRRQAAEPAAVVKTYADIAQAGYEDALKTGQAMQQAISAFPEDADRGHSESRARGMAGGARGPICRPSPSASATNRRRLGMQGECLAAR